MSQGGVGAWMTLSERLSALEPRDLQLIDTKAINLEIPTRFAKKVLRNGERGLLLAQVSECMGEKGFPQPCRVRRRLPRYLRPSDLSRDEHRRAVNGDNCDCWPLGCMVQWTLGMRTIFEMQEQSGVWERLLVRSRQRGLLAWKQCSQLQTPRRLDLTMV